MRINGHAHVFNLQTVVTAEAIDIIVERLRRMGYPDWALGAVRWLLERLLLDEAGVDAMSDADLLRAVLARMVGSSEFLRSAAVRGDPLPPAVALLAGGVDTLSQESLDDALAKLSAYAGTTAAVGGSLTDLWETLRIARKKTIVAVADALLRQLRPDDAIIALMMDIVGEDANPSDLARFERQLDGTAAAAAARPGRILPFIAVNPIRREHHALMVRAIEQRGFLGVKLYPSLGYRVDAPEMQDVFRYCDGADVPILVHASPGGFYKTPATAEYSRPHHWAPILDRHPRLRVCFAHCGGWAGFSGQDATHAEWWNELVALIGSYDNVFGDLAYHVDMMVGGDPERRYLDSLRELLADARFARRLIFGTDSWLVRLAISENTYWRWFESRLGEAAFAQIAELAPKDFLGIPTAAGQPPRGNVARHARWLDAQELRGPTTTTSWLHSVQR
jgi:predicted TIM-barrel fold metal-dependent hydrolase